MSKNIISPSVGNVIEHDGLVYRAQEAPHAFTCFECDFSILRMNGRNGCKGPSSLVCDGLIFKEVPAESVELIKEPKPKYKVRPLWLGVAAVAFWGVAWYVIQLIAK